jgi:DNA polymerase III delta' subunit
MNRPSSDQDILDRFKRLHGANRLAHAYLFSGPKQVDKLSTALAVAQLVNCQETDVPCLVCASCQKIAGHNHPDVYWIGSQEDVIKIDDIRQMLGRVVLRPFEARRKVFVLANVERMTAEAANALLKTLEEPAANTLMLLCTSNIDICLDTVKSRCHVVRFFSNSDQLPEHKNRILDMFLSRISNEEYFKALSANKEEAAAAMVVLLSWTRDVLLYKAGSSDLIYKDRLDDVKRMSQWGTQELGDLCRQIVRVKSLVDDNLNVKMALSLVRQRLWAN